jgi:hypothetical protein
MEAKIDEGAYVLSRHVTTYRRGKLYVSALKNGDLEVASGAHRLTLGGEYLMKVRLTKGDALRLFVESHRDDRFEDIVRDLAAAIHDKEED